MYKIEYRYKNSEQWQTYAPINYGHAIMKTKKQAEAIVAILTDNNKPFDGNVQIKFRAVPVEINGYNNRGFDTTSVKYKTK